MACIIGNHNDTHVYTCINIYIYIYTYIHIHIHSDSYPIPGRKPNNTHQTTMFTLVHILEESTNFPRRPLQWTWRATRVWSQQGCAQNALGRLQGFLPPATSLNQRAACRILEFYSCARPQDDSEPCQL